MRNAIWQDKGQSLQLNTAFSADLMTAAENSPIIAQLLANRGITTADEARRFLDLAAYVPTQGIELPEFDAAVSRVLQALEAKEPILIFGDFDVDGITGTSILYQTLKLMLGGNVSYYIPDRATEGHGLNATALCRLVSTRQTKLVITTDTGITNFAEVSLLKGLGVDTIVTDHHELPENLPPSVANVNPKLFSDQRHPLAYLAGVGVAFKLCEALLKAHNRPQEDIDALLDLVAVGTVADLAPLLRENRYLVYRGLQVLNRRQRLGFKVILENANVSPETPITSETVGFSIGPRLNAIGRLDNATDAVELLTTTDPERARIIAAKLEQLNRRRQELCDNTYLEAEKHLNAMGITSTVGLNGQKAIILASPDWNLGIIGIVASRLIEKYQVPVFLMVMDESKGEARCSARSIAGFNLHENLNTLSHYFTHFGGHSGAAGFGLPLNKLEGFKRDLYALADRVITDEAMRPVIEVDATLSWSQLNTAMLDLIDRLAPFGKENPAPMFVIDEARIQAQRSIGQDGNHLKLVLGPANGSNSSNTASLEALIWKFGQRDKLDPKAAYQFVVSLDRNTFQNQTRLQLIVKDYRLKTLTASGNVTGNITGNVIGRLANQLDSQRAGSVASPENQPILAHKNSAAVTMPESQASGLQKTQWLKPQWVDHRQRKNLEAFIGQLMLPQQRPETMVFYHEGRPPEIPFLDPAMLCTRQTLRPATELILWDLPPEASVLQAILQATQPSVVHLAGGKYLGDAAVPVFQAPRDFMKVLYQMLRRQQLQQQPETIAGQAPLALDLNTFAAQTSTSVDVARNGLLLLEKLGMLGLQAVELKADETTEQIVFWLLEPSQATLLNDLEQSVQFQAFQKALRQVGQYREVLLKSSIVQLSESVDKPLLTLS